jgi:4-alpha-glucanotransferase
LAQLEIELPADYYGAMRKSGILLHPTSLPGELGIGDLGSRAYLFADFLAESGQQLWQILPLGPTGFGHSPYQTYSSMAGNPLLISLQACIDQGLLVSADLQNPPRFPAGRVDFNAVIPFKTKLLKKAAEAFFQRGPDPLRKEFEEFCEKENYWLETYASFAALKEANENRSWTKWNSSINAEARHILDQKFIQFEFLRQWKALKRYCNECGIEIIGDIPIFVAHDSADVWANPDWFDLDGAGNPKTVAGVPPDYFSETGQRWGNPLYRWDAMEDGGYVWWIERVKSALDVVDIIRLDHFRGFEKYWSIPAECTTAVNGEWVEGPGDRLFRALENSLGKLPFIAEDLGYITPEVHQLRDRWGFPGMRVLQFAFVDESPANPHRPHNFIRDCVVYTGTHDNDTSAGWFAANAGNRGRAEIEAALLYMGGNGDDVWNFIRLALSSVANTAIVPMQDILGLGSEARMNRPSTIGNNWEWRMLEEDLNPQLARRLRKMNRIYGRLPN